MFLSVFSSQVHKWGSGSDLSRDPPPLSGACSSKGFTGKYWSRNALGIVSTVFCLVFRRKLNLPLIVCAYFQQMQFIFLSVAACAGNAGSWECGRLDVLGQSKTCLLCLLLPSPDTLHMAVPRTGLFNAWLLIALEIITFKLLVGDF